MAVGLDDPITPEQIEALAKTPNIISARVTKFA
jgi:hypothetical protein